ncbi:hypothetical protein MNBD_ALPHA11-1853 [hydrothermal vent metagenome]|uniref:ATPase BadF/BadG/BcrA/BcrD type domain-containing protein n=1 Tax=hydrothermal vent metagenome TaxID=652676 RepID=A0A3B0TTT0_9ZZZZ
MFLGVDGGGTKCRMRLVDQHLKTLGEAEIAAPSNLQVGNGEAAYAAIDKLTKMVFSKAKIDIDQGANVSACFGMAGARLSKAKADFAARPFPFASVKVVDDIDIARAGAHMGADGAVLISGTGSAGVGEVAGKRFQVGGWGFLVGDSMSGAWLGRKLIRKSLKAFEGFEDGSALTKAVMEKFDNDPQKLMEWSFANKKALAFAGSIAEISPSIAHARPVDYGAFVPMIFDFFEQKNDPVAKQLIAMELAAIEQYINWFLEREIKSIAIVGGLGKRLLPTLKNLYPGLIIEPKSAPLHGAIILAASSV